MITNGGAHSSDAQATLNAAEFAISQKELDILKIECQHY
jgi:hypothetical protein